MFKQRRNKGAIIRDRRSLRRALQTKSKRTISIVVSGVLTFGLIGVLPTPSRANTCTSPQTSSSGYFTIVRFTTVQSCTWTVPSGVISVDVLVVGGGGGAGFGNLGGGGGGGAVLYKTDFSVTPNSVIPIGVGGGGAGGWNSNQSSWAAGTAGVKSNFSTFEATGGGGGGGGSTALAGTAGGSGGGGAGSGSNAGGTSNKISYSTWTSLGNSGGSGAASSTGGGGGGAGAAGTSNGVGANGIANSITGTSTFYAGGGAGWGSSSKNGGLGGGGGAGIGISPASSAGTAGTNGLGGGGGGGQSGGSGVVIVRYQSPTVVSAPNSVSVTASPLALNVTWSAPTKSAGSVTSYQVEHSTTGTVSGTWTVASSSVPAGTTSFSITGLSNSTAYYVRVAARYSSGLGPYGYPWISKYRTTTPTRSGSSIVYDSSSAGQTDTNFSRVRYVMAATVNGAARSVDANFDKVVSGTSSRGNLDSISNLQVPTPGNSGGNGLIIQGNVSDLTVISSSGGLVVDGHGLTGRVELWGSNYGVDAPLGMSSRVSGTYDDADSTDGGGTYGSFQLHNLGSNSKQTIFAWNRHGGPAEIGFGNHTGIHSDWTFCTESSTCTDRTLFSLEVFVNEPVIPLVGQALIPTFGSVTATPVGYTTQITNYDPAYTWSGTATASGTVTISGSGLVTVTGVAPSTSSTATINTTRTGYTSGFATVSGTSSGPVLSYNFSDLNSYNSASPGIVTDLSGNSRTGTVTNGSGGATTSWTQSTGSITFPGGSNSTGPFIDVPNLLTTPFNAHGLTVDFEADFGSGANSYERILDFSEGGSANDNIAVYRLQNSSDLRLSIHNGSNGNYCTIAGAISENVLTRYTITANGSTCQLWKNGTSVSSQAFTARVSSGVTWVDNFIGKSNWSADAQYEGSIRSLRLYSGPFNPTQIGAFDYKAITYSANGGSSTPASGITSGSIRLPAEISRTGYAFQGWFNGATKRGDASASYTPTATETVQASWTANSNTVTFNSNFTGGPTATTQSVTTDVQTALTANTFTRTGYTFASWNTAANGSGTTYANGANVTINAALPLFAQWTANPNTVTFNSNYTGGPTATTQSITTDVQTELTANTFTRTGYTFAGWNTAVNGSGTAYTNSESVTINSALSLFAQWTANSNTVTFKSNYTGGPADVTQSITTDVPTALTSNTFSRTGYTFIGWNTAANYMGTGRTNGQIVTIDADLTLYARWTANSNTVTFNSNYTGGPSATTQSITTDVSTALTANTFTRTGYTFAGWNTATNGSGTTYTNSQAVRINSSVTLYAMWYRLVVTSQPVGKASGTTLQTQPVIKIEDGNGNIVTSDSTTSITAAISSGVGGTLGGTKTVTASNGVATFTNLTLAGVVGTDYVLSFTSSPTWNAATSQNVTVTPGAVSAGNSTVSPGTVTMSADGVSTQTFTVTLKDAQGNFFTSTNDTITFATDNSLGTFGSAINTAPGVYEGTYTSGTSPGTDTITVTANTIDLSTQPVITLNPGIPSESTSTVTAASASLTANGSSTSVVTIRLKDSSGNNIPRGGATVTIRVASGPGSVGSVTDNSDGTYSATYTSSTTAGTASLIAAVGGVDITDTETITLNPGAATKLGVTVQPSSSNASGAVLSTQPRIAVQDAFGNTVTSDSGRSITIGLIGNGGSITGTQTVSTSSGIVIFSGITLAGLISESYVLSFSANGLTGINSDPISITPGTASASTSTVVASTNSIVADGATTSTITVQLKDAQGNELTAAGGTVVVSKASGGGSVATTTNNNNGTYTAIFTSPTTVGTTVIQATVGGNTITDTETITLRHGVANKLVITQAPVAGASSSLLTTQPRVTLQDVNGNTVTSNSVDTVTVAISSGANGNLTGTKTLVLSSGVAAFTDLNLAGKTGTNYVLRFESGLFSTTSSNIQVAAGAASTVTSNVAVSSNSLTANGTTTSTITVTLRDSESNQLATGGQTVVLSVTSGFGSIGTVTDNEDGTYTASYTSGTTVGTATISATLNTAAIAETKTITLVHGPATKVTITQQPATGASGTNLTTQPKVVLRDANNNIATSDSSSTVSVAITSGSNGSLTGTKTVTVVAGEAVFTDLSFAGIVGTDYKLRFSSGSLTVADSNNLRVTPGVAVVGTSTITASSSSITANGVSTSTITVQLKDAQGNSLTINDDAVSIRVDSGTGNVGSTLPAGNGTYTATFTSSTTAGTSTIRATLGGADITASQDISLTPGTATKLGILTEPPNTTSSGVVLATQPRIAIQDAFGNTVTSDSGRSVEIGVVGNDGSVGGTTTRTSASGIVTFSGISLAGLTSNGYRLSFTTSGLTGVNSQIITLTPGAASTATSVVSASTTSIVANGSTTSTITVTLKDAQGNLLVATGGTVVVSMASGDGSISTTTDNGNGTYTATFTSPRVVGTTVIQATIGGNTITDTESITLVHGDATQIKITQTPITGANASTFTRQPKITLFDANDNVVTSNSSDAVEVALFSGENGTLSGTTQATFTNGVASFTNLAITGRTSTDYVLRFTSGSFTVDSGDLNLTPGTASAATSTVVISDSTLIANGSSTATVTVRLRDAQTNSLVASGGTVAITVATGDGSISTVTNNNDGTYTATYTSGTVVGIKTISASVNSATLTDTEQVTLVPGPATKLRITQQPTGTSSGTALGTQPIVEITDAFNNRVTGDSSTQVTAAISSGTGGTLGGTRTVTAALGLATFTDVTLAGLVSQSYKLTFSSGSLTVIESSAISVTPGVAVASTSTISASSTSITANGSTTSVITVQLKDAQGNSLTTSGGTVGMRIASGTGTLDSVSNVGNGTYTSTYTSSQIAGAIEIRASLGDNELTEVQNLTLTPGAATKLAIYQAPISQRSGEVLSTQPKISVQDQFGNVVTGDSGRVVTVAIAAGNGGSLDGTLTASTVNGIATFTNVVLAGITTSNYVLSFTTPNLTSVNSGVLTVSSGSAQVATSTFGVSASSIVANGVTTSVVTVTIRDAKENALTASAGTLEMFVTSGHQGSISGVTNNGDGTYTATYTSGTLVSNATITAKLNGVALTQSATISLTAGPATQLEISTQPAGSASAEVLSQQPVVHLLDAFGNHAIQDSTTSVTAIINSGSFGSLGGTTIKQASQGVVTFTDLTLAGRVSENYKLRFSSGSLVVADSNNVTVTPGAPSTETSLVSSAVTTLVAETTNTTTVTITLKDAQGNLLTTGGATVGLAVSPVTSGFTDLGNVGSVTDRSNGTYTATYTAGTKVQSVRFSATLGGAAIADTSQLSLTHGAAYQIAVQTNPVGGASGSQLTTQPVVLVQDRHGNTVTSDNGTVITAALGGFQNTGTLSGTRTAVTSNGQAAFAGIVMSGRINTQYVLAFTSSGLVSVNSDNFEISQGPTNVTNSTIEADAAAIVANGTATTVITVSIKDTEGNVVAASAGTVALTVAEGTGSLSAVVDNNNGTYTSTFTAGTVSGTAQIIGTLNGSALGGSASIILTSGPAENAQILVAPGTSASGALLNPQPQIVIKDVNGNTVTSDSSTIVTLSLKSGYSGTLAGTLTATASSGIAQFSNVTLSGLVGTNYVLEFDPNTSGVRSIDSAAINLTPGTPTQLVLTTPAATANSGQAFVTQPVLTAKDAQGNVATNFTADVTASVSGATLQGSITKSLSNGVATFTDLGMLGTANASYQVTYATSALNLSANQSLLLNPGSANNLLIVSQPTTEMNGRAFVTQPVIQIRDAQNNAIVTNTPVSVVASINTGSGTLSGATSVATNSTGRATFTDLMVTGNTGSYTLTFAVVGLSIDSNSFALTPGDQTITRSTFGSTALPNGTYTPTATAYSGLSVAISIASTSATVCSIEDGEVTFLKMGDCAIKYNQTGNTHWSPAPELVETLSVGRLTQTTTFAAIDDQPFGGTDVALTATAQSGLLVTFAVTSASTVCVLNTATTVQIVGLGTCTVVASQSGDEVWAPASDVTRSFVIGTVRPATPTVSSVSAGNAQATISWNPPTHNGGSPILGYRVTSQPGGLTCETNNSSDSSCIVTGLTNGTEYTFVVQALNAIGYSNESADSPVVTPATTADAVVGLTLTSTNKKLTANWIMPEQLGGGNFVRFEMFIRETGGTYGDAFTSNDANLTTFDFTKLDPNDNTSASDLVNGESYDVKIVIITDAIMAGDQSVTVLAGNSTEATQVPADVASAPTNATILTTDGTQASVSWIASSSNGGAVITAYSVTATANNVAVTCVMQLQLDTSCEISSLTPGQVINVSIRAVNRIGNSVAATASMKLPTPPAPPTMNAATAGSGFIQVTWAVPASDGGMALTGYVAKAMVRGTNQVVAECTTIGTSCDLMVSGTEFDFDFAVWSMNRVGMSDSSNMLSPKRPTVSPTPTPSPSGPRTRSSGTTNAGAAVAIFDTRRPVFMPNGELPELNVGTTMAWRNGEFVEVNLVSAGTSALQLSAAGGVVLQMQTLHLSGQPMDVAANGMLQVFHNHSIRIAGSGFAPNTMATVWLFSEPVKLGEIQADANGGFADLFAIDTSIPLGDHTIQINGQHTDGSVRTVAMGVSVFGEDFAPEEVITDASGQTDSDSNQVLGVIGAVGLAFLGGIGVGILMLGQRRRKS